MDREPSGDIFLRAGPNLILTETGRGHKAHEPGTRVVRAFSRVRGRLKDVRYHRLTVFDKCGKKQVLFDNMSQHISNPPIRVKFL